MGFVKSTLGIQGSAGGAFSRAFSRGVGSLVKKAKKVTAPVVKPVEKAAGQVTSNLANLPGSVENTVKQVAANPVAQIAMAYYMPGIANSLAPSLATLGVSATYQAAVANAITSITLQVAQGVPLEKAIQTATINAIVSTGSQTAATELNNVIKNPAITDAIVSAGSSAAKTALNGGSKEDIERNLLGGLLGSATASSTGSTVAGSAVGGGVTGGVLGALTGAAGALGKPEDKSTKTADAGTSTDPGIQVAGGDDSTALNMASISAMPEMLGKSGETASALSPVVEEGQTFYERTITGKTPDGKEYSYTVSYDPNAPAGKQVSYTSSGVVKDAQGNVIPTGGGSATASFTRPDFTTATTTGTYTPTIITPDGTISTGGTGGTTGVGAGSTPVSPAPVTPTPVSPDKPILDLIAPTLPTTQPVTPTPVAPPTSPVEPTTPTPVSPDQPILDLINPPITPSPVTPSPVTPVSPAPTTPIAEPITSEKPVVTPPKEPEVIPPVEPTTPEKPVVEAITPEETTTPEEKAPPEELPPVEDKTGTPVPYKPNIYTYGGTSPDVLARTLNAPFYPVAGTTGGLTSTRGAGEIESKETGKKRKNVWNEESLRLKDALGV